MDELIHVLKKIKNNRSPGPDGIPIEFFKLLNADGLKCTLRLLNKCWNDEVMPDEFELAEVVTLYKKGNVELPENYRPIALLNTLYKIYASILQQRLAKGGIEEKLWKSQYGFRRCKSTCQPLHITRRIQDFAEASHDKLILVFLDWEKAFDKVDQEMLV